MVAAAHRVYFCVDVVGDQLGDQLFGVVAGPEAGPERSSAHAGVLADRELVDGVVPGVHGGEFD